LRHFLLWLFTAAILAEPAAAHPHAFIALRTSLLLNEQGLVTGVREEWQFDDNYTATALEGLDTDGDGTYSAAEIAPLTDENIKSLREYDYFTVIRQKGEKQAIADVTAARQVHDGSLLKMVMDVPLVTPLDPTRGEIQVKVYDPEFFIAYDYQKADAFSVAGGKLPASCQAQLLPVPTDEELEQKRDFLAQQSPDWKPETEEDFGAVFAQPLSVVCGNAGLKVSPLFFAAANTVVIDKNKLLVQQRGGANVSFKDNPGLWVMQQQRNFYGKLSGALRGLQTSSSAMWSLLSLSFFYGVFHAAGPGHGKAVISTWLLATENDLKRGVLIAFLSALIQALTAIVLVSALFLMVASAGTVARNVSGYLESASYAMIAGLGLYLIWTAFSGKGHAHSHDHQFHEHQGHHQHGHHHDEHCSHAHVAQPQDLRGEWSLTRAFSLAFATGIRPCTGAILVLVFANSIGLYWAGIVSTLAMGFGVFLAVAIIAAITVYAKQHAVKFAAGRGNLLSNMLFGARIAGGAVIALLGFILFAGSLNSSAGMI
jgi:nickel/cobalt transporter (NicO) family protein